ncbi:MAG: lipopolysaccharide biosynthesis protein [Flavobacterium sp.]
MSGFYKGISGLSLFVSIPLLIKYLGNSDYGIWVLVFTLFQWVLVMDFGIQSSLKTKIPILFHNNQLSLIKSYIKITYIYAVLLALGIFLLFTTCIFIFDLQRVLNLSFHTKSYIHLLFIINIFFFCINSVAGIHKSLYVAYLKGKYAEESLAVNQFGFLILICLLVIFLPNITAQNKLLFVSFINGLFCLFVNVFYTIRFFKMEKLDLKTNEKPPKDFVKDIIKTGLKFMAIQLGMMLFFTVDNYIISNNFSPKDVVPYDTVTKIFQLPVMILFAALSPLWSMFAKDYIERNRENLLRNFRKFNIYFVGISFFIFLLYLICPFLISIWIKEKLEIPEHLILYIAIVTAFRIFAAFYSYFLNGVGKLNRFIFIVVASLLLKIPLTYFLIYLSFGINSVIISTLCMMVFWITLIPLECYNITNNLKNK